MVPPSSDLPSQHPLPKIDASLLEGSCAIPVRPHIRGCSLESHILTRVPLLYRSVHTLSHLPVSPSAASLDANPVGSDANTFIPTSFDACKASTLPPLSCYDQVVPSVPRDLTFFAQANHSPFTSVFPAHDQLRLLEPRFPCCFTNYAAAPFRHHLLEPQSRTM